MPDLPFTPEDVAALEAEAVRLINDRAVAEKLLAALDRTRAAVQLMVDGYRHAEHAYEMALEEARVRSQEREPNGR